MTLLRYDRSGVQDAHEFISVIFIEVDHSTTNEEELGTSRSLSYVQFADVAEVDIADSDLDPFAHDMLLMLLASQVL
jgi:hypothetical protein